MKKYIISEGEMLDQICFKHYGTIDVVEEILKWNPDLANYIGSLPYGMTINLPKLNTSKILEQIQLWE